jgi:hypothetical protein
LIKAQLSVIEEKQQQQQLLCRPEHQEEEDPMTVFLYALKAPETKRRWPRRY